MNLAHRQCLHLPILLLSSTTNWYFPCPFYLTSVFKNYTGTELLRVSMLLATGLCNNQDARAQERSGQVVLSRGLDISGPFGVQ
jgi:hypothetical protein